MRKSGKKSVVLRVNGEEHELLIYPHRTLSEVLREELQLTGTKQSCNEGACGSCTVLLDGLPVRSCLLLAADVEGREITTIEGLAEEGKLHPLQASFVEHYAIQCGFCTPGMIMNAYAMMLKNPKMTRKQIIEGMDNNLCRCSGHQRIVQAIESVAGKR